MFTVRRIGKRSAVQYQRNQLADALRLALRFLNDDADSFVTTLINTETGEVFLEDGIRDLAAKTPDWENSSFEAPDIHHPLPYDSIQ